MGGLEMPDQAEQQVGAGADEITQPDAAVVRGQRDEIVDRGVDSVQRLGAGVIDAREVERLTGEIEVEELPSAAEVG